MRSIALLTSTVLALASCSSGDQADDSEADSTIEAPAQATSPSGVSGSEETETASTPASVTAPATPVTEPLLDGIEPSVDLLTTATGGGIRPLLEWEPHDNAGAYTVTVYAPDGSAYWSWTGSTTSVHVGGEPVLDDTAPGPSVIDGMSWGVIALSDSFVPIATSHLAPIGP